MPSVRKKRNPARKMPQVVVEDTEYQLTDRVGGKWKYYLESTGAEYTTMNKNNWIGHVLRRNCHLKPVLEEKKEGKIKVVGRRRIRRKQLLDELREKIEYRKLNREALDRTLSRTRFGRGYGTDVWQTTELLLLLLLSSSSLLLSSLSPLCRVFTIIYLNQTMFLGYIVLQLFCICNAFYM